MRKQSIFAGGCALLISLLLATTISASGVMSASSFRVTILENDVTYEYEYDNPHHYEYEEGRQVVRGEEAKQKVVELLTLIKLNENSKIEDIVRELKQHHPDVVKVDIRYMNDDNKLFTWVWHDE
jgi:hypothetical protein